MPAERIAVEDVAGQQRLLSAVTAFVDRTSDDIFRGRTVVVFSLPGAFTPTCSSSHLQTSITAGCSTAEVIT